MSTQGHLAIGLAAVGGAYARCRVDCTLAGRGATGDMSAMYFGDRDQVLDFRTFQNHLAPDTNSNLLFVGAVEDRARSIYSGLIRVGPEARGTDAQQTNRILKLSEEVWADSVPNLEIENNDVRCAHASSVGPIDERSSLLPREPGCATRRGGASDRGGLLRRGARPVAGAVGGGGLRRDGARQDRSRSMMREERR